MSFKRVIQPCDAKPIKIWTEQVEESAEKQLRNLSRLPFIHKHIAVMPDVHAGIGSTVGTVIATKRAIIPAAVGVDIGCGMMAVKLNITASQLPDNLAKLRSRIEVAVPHGRTDNGGLGDRGAWGSTPFDVVAAFRQNGETTLFNRLLKITNKHTTLQRAEKRAPHHMGTLGTGNHFIEVCLDTEQNVWVMLHSGSRGIGNKIGSYFIEQAKDAMERWHIELDDPDLAFLPQGEELFDDYIEAMTWAQDYATTNREVMMKATLGSIQNEIPNVKVVETAINCHHNYATMENHFGENVWVTRKGAVRARQGDLGIIPGSMGAKSFIVRGKGDPESFCSCSHGAGRRMSRTAARRQFTKADLEEQTLGVECRKDEDVIDEIPSAYKSIDEVMANQEGLVEVVATLKQILCVKG